MPCYTIRRIRVSFEKIVYRPGHMTLLMEALAALGYHFESDVPVIQLRTHLPSGTAVKIWPAGEPAGITNTVLYKDGRFQIPSSLKDRFTLEAVQMAYMPARRSKSTPPAMAGCCARSPKTNLNSSGAERAAARLKRRNTAPNPSTGHPGSAALSAPLAPAGPGRPPSGEALSRRAILFSKSTGNRKERSNLMAQSNKPPAAGADGSRAGRHETAPDGPIPEAQTRTFAMTTRDRDTVLLALRLARDFLASLIESETPNGPSIAPGHPVRAMLRRWQQQVERIAELEARLGRGRKDP